MKKRFTLRAMGARFRILFFGAALFVGLSSFQQDKKFSVCHTPPGNPGNCHEIKVGASALQFHLNHGDPLYCDDAADYEDYLDLVDDDGRRIIRRY